MFQPREIVYGYAKNLYSPHNKYIVTLYQDEELNVVGCFTTSQSRAGVSEEEIQHGTIYRNKECVSYVFEKGVSIGKNPSTGEDFAFPKRSVITFDYGIKEGTKESFVEEMENTEVVCVLDENEYVNLIYAMYRSPYTKTRHKIVLDKILQDFYANK